MELATHCLVLLIIEVIKLGLVVFGILDFKPKRKFVYYLLVTIALLFLVGLFTDFIYEDANLIDYNLYNILNILIVILFYFGITGKKKLLTVVVSYASLSVIDMAISGIILIFFNASVDHLIENPYMEFIFNSISIIILLVIVILKYKIKTNFSNTFLTIKSQYIVIIILGIIACGFYIAPMLMFGIGQNQLKIQSIMIFGVSISGIIFIVVCVGIVIMKESKNHYRSLSNMNEMLVEQQRNYYSTLIEKEQNTKRFRHDINNHVFCMQHLCEQQKYDELLLYLRDMRSNIEELNIDIQTGNDVVNVIINELYLKNKDSIHIKWNGIIPSSIKISAMDLCTIFSNLITNAIEAVKGNDDNVKKIIEVSIKKHQQSLFITISNTISKKVIIANNILITTKQDKEIHGFGSMNVKRSVLKYKGKLEYYSTNDNFTVEIIFTDILN